MTNDARAEQVAAELQLANECLAAAKHERSGGFHRRAVSSAYYAAFHAARATLAETGIEPRSHEGVQQLFSLHFIKPGLFPASDGRLLRRMQKDREEADYAHYGIFTDEDSKEAVDSATLFLNRVQAHLVKP